MLGVLDPRIPLFHPLLINLSTHPPTSYHLDLQHPPDRCSVASSLLPTAEVAPFDTLNWG
jgi:hypothetical protein